MLSFVTFILCGMILANPDQCSENQNTDNKCFSQAPLEQQFLQVISIIESQTSDILKFQGSEAVFLVGETGCGKSTILNWLMGRELIAVKDQEKSISQWNVDVPQKDTSTSNIGHSSVSQTSVPTFGKMENEIYLVDFPGWGDNRGWQHDLVNQYLSSKTSENYSKIKIVFICEYQYFESKRGNGLKEMITKIDHFAQSNLLEKSAMLVITKATFDDLNDANWEQLKQKYIKDVRREFQKFLNQTRAVSEQFKKIIGSLVQNDIYIMRKAGAQKQQYTLEESQELKIYIGKLESGPLKLKPNMTTDIINQFNNYFTKEFNAIKERVKSALRKIKATSNLVSSRNELNTHNILSQIIRQIEQFENVLQQQALNQIMKYNAFESLYINIMQAANLQVEFFNYNNLLKIYNYFFPLKDKISAYQLEIFDDELLVDLKKYFNEKSELQRIHQVLLEERRRSGRVIRNEVNKHRGWWKFWLPNKIPNTVNDEEVEQFIRWGG